MIPLPRLMLVTDRRRYGEARTLDAVASALTAGPVVLQIREKDLPDRDLEAMVRRYLARAGERAVAVVNGRPAVARRTGCGLHLPARDAVSFSGPAPVRPIGCSIHAPSEVAAALALQPDYLVAGTVFPTGSKPGLEGCGLAGLQRLTGFAGDVPVYAIGGMRPESAAAAVAAGAWGVAACEAVLGSADPARETARFLAALGRGSKLEG